MDNYYISETNHSREYKKQSWDMAMGLQAVDDLKTSGYLRQLADEHIDGTLTNEEIEKLLYKKYENETLEEKLERNKESDLVANRIVKLLAEKAFSFSPVTLKHIHCTLFEGIYEHAGLFRQYNISKDEPILNGATVIYADFRTIEETLRYDFLEEKERKYSTMSKEKVLDRISKFTSDIWQVHPFMEGNTRTTAVFMERYLNSLGFKVNNIYFAENSKYYRNALVRSNYAEYGSGIDEDMSFLRQFYENLLYDGKNVLQSRNTIITKAFHNRDANKR